ncbi:MAG: acyltransferase, partial [Gemmatimonadaceae bacterium]
YAREFAPWLLTYTINIKMAAQGWYIDNFAHFWSLAIEEQYYLVWPWLILLLPRRLLLPVGVLMTAVGPLFRLFLVIGWKYLGSEASGLQSYIATPAALDSLGMGSLVAIMLAGERTRMVMAEWMRWAVPVMGLVFAVALYVIGGDSATVLWDTAQATIFAWLIYRASFGFGGLTGRVLSARPLVYLGRISYGIYVYHELVPNAVRWAAPSLGFSVPIGVWSSFLLHTALTLLISALSWRFFERPINELKRQFPYLAEKKPAMREPTLTLETSDAHQ